MLVAGSHETWSQPERDLIKCCAKNKVIPRPIHKPDARSVFDVGYEESTPGLYTKLPEATLDVVWCDLWLCVRFALACYESRGGLEWKKLPQTKKGVHPFTAHSPRTNSVHIYACMYVFELVIKISALLSRGERSQQTGGSSLLSSGWRRPLTKYAPPNCILPASSVRVGE